MSEYFSCWRFFLKTHARCHFSATKKPYASKTPHLTQQKPGLLPQKMENWVTKWRQLNTTMIENHAWLHLAFDWTYTNRHNNNPDRVNTGITCGINIYIFKARFFCCQIQPVAPTGIQSHSQQFEWRFCTNFAANLTTDGSRLNWCQTENENIS